MAGHSRKRGKRHQGTHWNKLVLIAVVVIVVLLVAATASYALTRTTGTAPQTGQILNYSWGSAGLVHQYDGGINHTYYVDKNIGNINVSLNDTIMGPVTVYRGVLFVTTAGPYHDQLIADYKATPGSLAAIDAYTGNVVWRDYFPNQFIGQPVTIDNMLIVSMSNNEEIPPPNFTKFNNMVDAVYAINMSNGAILWKSNLSAPSMLTPAYAGGRFFLPSMGGYLMANVSTGNVIYSNFTDLPDTMSSPLLVNGTVYFGAGTTNEFTSDNITGDFIFYSINFTSGTIKWTHKFPEAGSGLNDVSPGYYKGIIITGYLNHSMYDYPTLIGMNASDGKVIWKVDEEYETTKLPVITPSTYYAVGGEPLTEPTMTAITMYNGTAYADSNFLGVLFAVNATDGAIRWMFNTGQCESNPNIHDGYLYIMNDVGILYVLNAGDGALVNELNTGMHHLSNEITIAKNKIILTSLNGSVVTIPISRLTNPSQ